MPKATAKLNLTYIVARDAFLYIDTYAQQQWLDYFQI